MTAIAANPTPYPGTGHTKPTPYPGSGTIASWRGQKLVELQANDANGKFHPAFSVRPIAGVLQFLSLGKGPLADAAVAARQMSLNTVGKRVGPDGHGSVVANPPIMGLLQTRAGVYYATYLGPQADSTTQGYATTPQRTLQDVRLAHPDLKAVISAEHWFNLTTGKVEKA